MREGRERWAKFNFPEVAFCFSPLTFPSVRNSALYKREIILQTNFLQSARSVSVLYGSAVAPQMGENWSF